VGYVSVKAAPVIGTAPLFESVTVRREVAETTIDAGENDLAAVGGSGLTVRMALADAAFAFALADVTAPAAIVSVYEPAVLLTTDTVTVQFPFAGMVPLLSATELPFGLAVTVPPPHVVAPFGVEALTRFAG